MEETTPIDAHDYSPSLSATDLPSPLPRNSMEDENSAMTRKRPRLDSGERAHQNITSPYFLAPDQTADHKALSSVSGPGIDSRAVDDEVSARREQDSDQADGAGASSKVTLNLREPPQTEASAVDVSVSESHGQVNTIQDDVGRAQSDQDPTHTLHPSPQEIQDAERESSVHIEVAEPEDLGAPEGHTAWRHAAERNWRDWQRAQIDRFPSLANTLSWEQEMRTLPHTALQEPGLLSTLLAQIAIWVREYLLETQDFPEHWIEIVTSGHEFWQALPGLLDFLSEENSLALIADTNNERPAEADSLNAFISSFISLTARMAAVDRKTLELNKNARCSELVLSSMDYLKAIYQAFQPKIDGAGWTALERSGVDLSLLIRSLVTSGQGHDALLNELTDIIPHMLSRPSLEGNPLDLLKRILAGPAEFFQLCQGQCQEHPTSEFARAEQSFLQFFQDTDRMVRSAIKKQQPSLSGELFTTVFVPQMQSFITNATSVVSVILSRYDLDTNHDVASLAANDRTQLAEAMWKLDIFERAVREGRMEIRLAGLDALQSGLIEVYQRYIGNRHADETKHPIVEAISARLLQNKVVEYLISVDSHPQIICRSANVVGFVAVSKHWSNEQTDSIWQTVEGTEDIRACETILDMLPAVTKYLDPTDLVHVIRKMQDTTISRVDTKVLHLLLTVCSQLREKTTDEAEALTVSVTAFAVLLRKASADPSLSITRKHEFWSTVQQGFKNLAAIEWPTTARTTIYTECFQDLNSQSLGTSGSCAIIRRILERYSFCDLPKMLQEIDATALVVSDFARLGQIEVATRTAFEGFMAPVEDRLCILEMIIRQLPGAITNDETAQLWSSMIGENTVSYRVREAAWEMLARIATNSRDSNSFLEQCLHAHLPVLDASFFSRSTLAFAHCLSEYEHRVTPEANRVFEDGRFPNISSELFWQLALAAEDDQISAKASHALIERTKEHSKGADEIEGEFALIDRCVAHVIDIGAQLRSSAASSTDADGTLALKRQITRVFTILSHCFGAARDDSPMSPSNRSESQTSQSSLLGERVQVKYITSDLGFASAPKTLDIGGRQNLKELLEKLRDRSGFTKFNAIVGGQRLDLERQGDVQISSLGLLKKGAIILHRVPGSEVLKADSSRDETRPIENVVSRHFDKLYALLSLDNFVADHVLQFLRMCAPQEEIFQLVCSSDSDQQQILPLETPHKALYSLHAIATKYRSHLNGGTIDYEFMQHCVRVLTDALLALQLPLAQSKTRRALLLPAEVLSTMLSLLKEPVPAQIAAGYFTAGNTLVERLFEIANASASTRDQESFNLCQSCFAVVLEISRLNESAWKAYSTDKRSLIMFDCLVLINPIPRNRHLACQTVNSIMTTLTDTQSTDRTSDKALVPADASEALSKANAFVKLFWDMIITLVPKAAKIPGPGSQQFFTLASSLFNDLDEDSVVASELQRQLQLWAQLLLDCELRHVVTRDVTDWAVRGLGELIIQALLVLNRRNSTSGLGPDFRRQLFERLLFPPLQGPQDYQADSVNIPVLGSQTRATLYNVVIRSMSDTDDFSDLFSLLNEVILDEASVLPSINFDRARQMRAVAGYPGLDNLSNTCYLNSLMTQLFMNPRFREFILQCEIFDRRSQALLVAMQRLFAGLQDGWQRSVSTKELADSIETYDGPLDPTLQMDADEAFNLLFDRLESQISRPREKEILKRLYGGKIIQQIKSKECDHVSERFEPVTAIQCDIQGKRNLQQSLQAYIEGETMEGDNKYKCSKCDRYVNAVKRACLKDIPDNLIFHLKRFDFDLGLGTRNKVNDHFAFTEIVDMAPYTIDYLENKSSTVTPDPFLLVGVLVHNGNAELGHYYSYIRERPGNLQSWIEFNDSDVSHFDASSMGDQCFGGTSENTFNQSFAKSWNAYMLFYQRKSSIVADEEHFGRPADALSLRIPAREPIAAEILSQNEHLARIYCLSGPEHAQFVQDVLAAFVRKRGLSCTDDHRLEEEAVDCAWAHLENVFGRDIKRQGVTAPLEFLQTMVSHCPRCCKVVLDRLMDQDDSRLRFLLLRLPDPDTRSKICSLVIDALRRLKVLLPDVYGSDAGSRTDAIDSMQDEPSTGFENGVFAAITDRLLSLLDFAPLNFKAWPEFYNLLSELANLGRLEMLRMHDVGFLQHSLEVLLIEPGHEWESRYRGRHFNYIKLVGKRAYNLSGLLNLVVKLLEGLRFEDEGSAEMTGCEELYRTTFTRDEKTLLTTRLVPDGGQKRVPWVLERAAVASEFSSEHGALESLTRFYINNEAFLGLEHSIHDLIGHGIVKSPADLATPYLRIALAFITTSVSQRLIEQTLIAVADGTKTIGETGGAEHLEFFKRSLWLKNETAFPDQPRQLMAAIIHLCHIWGPALLDYPDKDVATDCREFLERILFHLPEQFQDDEEVSDVATIGTKRVWTIVSNRVEKYVREDRALDEHKRPILLFCETCLTQQYPRSATLNDGEQQTLRHFKELLSQAHDLIAPRDDAGSNAFDSDDLTDVSSTYESPGVEEVS